MTSSFTTDSGLLPAERMLTGKGMLVIWKNGGAIQWFRFMGQPPAWWDQMDITTKRLESWGAIVCHPSQVPTFHYDGIDLFTMAMFWRWIARVADRADKLFWNPETVEDCPPFHVKPWGKFARPRSRLRLWSQWYDPLPELFNATVDPWTRSFGVVA